MGKVEVEAFLGALAVERNVSAATQTQALSALLFLYRDVLGNELPWLDDLVRAKKQYFLTLIPAFFMTCVCTTYICIAPEGFGLSHPASYGIGAAGVAIALVWFVLWKKRQTD